MTAAARKLWENVRVDAATDRGLRVRAHFRPLPRNFWSRLIGAHAFHAWFELLDPRGRELDLDRLFVWGVYEGRFKDGPRKGEHNGRAKLKWMIWEYEEDGGLARWAEVEGYRRGHVDIELPKIAYADFLILWQLVFDDLAIDLGPYGYLRPLLGRLTGVWSCQRYVQEFSRRHGGPSNLVSLLRRHFRAH